MQRTNIMQTLWKESCLTAKKMENENRYFDLDSLNHMQNVQENTPKDNEKRKMFWRGILIGLLIAIIVELIAFGAAKITGSRKAERNLDDLEISENSAINMETIRKLQTLEATIDKYFYLDGLTDEKLQDGLYKGMLASLGDPYSEYYTAVELEDLMSQMSGVYYGIGAYVSMDKNSSLPKISGVIAGTPAEAAGLRANDLIYQVDDVATYGLTLTEAVSYIRGEEGTQVTLTIVREGVSDYLQVTATRQKVYSPTVKYEKLDNGMGYIQIVEFDDITADQFADALATLRGSDMKGLILDLRANPGGGLTSVVDISEMLLPKGLVVYTEDKNGKRVEYKSDGAREIDIPMVVLVDMNSASAAEILAGAIQDYEKGTLIGTTTFGKGIVQQIIPFRDGSAMKVTVSSYFTPKGRNIYSIGIEPDIICEFDGETYYNTEGKYDNQLEKAKEVLGGMMK